VATAQRRQGIDRLRVGELRRIVRDWRDGGVVFDRDLAARLFRVAVPHLARGGGNLVAFARDYATEHFEALGREHFASLERDFRTGRAKPPSPLKADEAARVLGITDAERTRLDLRTIGAIDRDKAQRQADRAARKAETKREKRAKAEAADAAARREKEAKRKRDERKCMPREEYEAQARADRIEAERLGVHPRTVKRGREKEASCPSVRPAPPRRMSKCVRVKVCPAPICSEGASVCVSNKPPGVVSAAAIARLPASDEPSPERVNDPRWAELLVQGCRSTRPRRDSRVAPAR
jgi:hypothetical protein